MGAHSPNPGLHRQLGLNAGLQEGASFINTCTGVSLLRSVAIEQQSIDEDKAFRVNLWLLLGTL